MFQIIRSLSDEIVANLTFYVINYCYFSNLMLYWFINTTHLCYATNIKLIAICMNSCEKHFYIYVCMCYLIENGKTYLNFALHIFYWSGLKTLIVFLVKNRLLAYCVLFEHCSQLFMINLKPFKKLP